MKLYFMKNDAMEFLKRNINTLYTHYYTDETCDWISEAYGAEAFSEFKEVPDFELCELGEKTTGEIDFENIQTVYTALKSLSESQASDERLWAGLCNKVFYGYIRRRWKYDEEDITDAEKDAGAIISRFFFKGGGRGGFFRNTISRYWWVGRLTYDEANEEDYFHPLKVLGSSDLISKISEIFYSNTFVSNEKILRAFINALDTYYENNIYISVREVIRPTVQYLNAVGGAICLDALEEEEITQITIEKINSLLKGKESALTVDEEETEEFDASDEEEVVAPINAPEVVDSIISLFDSEKPVFICKGDHVKILIEDTKVEKTVIIPKDKDRMEMGLVESLSLGKKVGDSFILAKHKYIIKSINS